MQLFLKIIAREGGKVKERRRKGKREGKGKTKRRKRGAKRREGKEKGEGREGKREGQKEGKEKEKPPEKIRCFLRGVDKESFVLFCHAERPSVIFQPEKQG